jgi:hypothetical protein
VRGKAVRVPSAQIDGRTVITRGRWLKMAVVESEEEVQGETVPEPSSFISQLKKSGLKADLFTFAQKVPDTNPRYTYHLEWDSKAVIPITKFSDWWEKRVEHDVRAAVRKAAKAGVVVKLVKFDDAFVNGMVSIYNETPIRQGKRFWHFGISFDAAKRGNSTFPGRNIFLGAYYAGELIGFIRLICVEGTAILMQLLSKMKYSNKKPNNALLAKAVELCEQRGFRYLTYGRYIYNDARSSLTEFKRRNGFEQVLLPRYYIPLTPRGKIALKLGLHRGLAGNIPKPLFRAFLKIRSFWYALRWKQPNPNPA